MIPAGRRPGRGEGRRARIAVALVVCAAALGAFGCGNTPGGTASATAEPPETVEREPAIAVHLDPVARRSVSAIYSTSATLRADREAVVTARAGGVLRRLLVEEGDWVEADQVLAVLEDEEQRIEFARAATTRDTHLREYERASSLHDQGLMSEEEYEAIRRQAEEARHAADLSDLLLRRTVVHAPFAGRILRRHLDVGATVSDGSPVYDLADLEPLYADVNVPEREVGQLAPGRRVRAVGGASNDVARGRIERIAPVVDSATGTVKVTVAIDGAGRLKPGSFVRVEIVTDTHERALVVPRTALVAEGRRWHLFRLAEDGEQVRRIEVERGFEERDFVEILNTPGTEDPLAPGDRVVVTGASTLADGSRVREVDTVDEAPETEKPDVPA